MKSQNRILFSNEGLIPLSMAISTRMGAIRSIAERLLAALLLVAVSPILLLSMLLVRLTSSGPAIYRQIRAGRHGKPFTIVKLRSMYQDSESVSGARWCSGKADPRVTPLGRLLRASHIDELPQLWNVLTGDMAFVGPRPERPEILANLEIDIPGVRDRVAVKPGITGLAQIQQPSDQSTDCFRKKLDYDRAYIRHQSVWLDLRIVIGTGLYLVGCSYGCLRSLLQLPHPADFQTATVEITSEPAVAQPIAEVS